MKWIDEFQSGTVSFWETFPHMVVTQPFKDLYKKDRSKDKNKSSKVMWYMVLTCDLDSDYYSMSEDEQKEIVCDILDLNVPKQLSKEEFIDLRFSFENFIDTTLSADVRAQEAKLIERKQFIQKTPYTLDEMVTPTHIKTDKDGNEYEVQGKPYLKKGTAAQLDKMMTDTKKIHDEIRSLRQALRSEQSEQGKGGKEDSFLEG